MRVMGVQEIVEMCHSRLEVCQVLTRAHCEVLDHPGNGGGMEILG